MRFVFIRSRRLSWTLFAVFFAIAAGLALSWMMSAQWAATQLVSAVQGRNLAVLIRRVDIACVRSSAADDWSEFVPTNLKLPGLGNVSEELRTLVNAGLRNLNVDEPTLADMLSHLLSGQGLVSATSYAKVPTLLAAKRTPVYSYAQGPTSDIYLLKASFVESGEQLTVTFERSGWFTWRAVRMQPNSGSLLWPFRLPR